MRNASEGLPIGKFFLIGHKLHRRTGLAGRLAPVGGYYFIELTKIFIYFFNVVSHSFNMCGNVYGYNFGVDFFARKKSAKKSMGSYKFLT